MVSSTVARPDDISEVVLIVKAMPRHRTREFRFARRGFFHKLDLLVSELDDVGEFIHLEASNRSYVLRIRHR